jgi:integrase
MTKKARPTAQQIDVTVRNLAAPEKDRIDIGFFDSFGIRVAASGKKSFITRYRLPPNSNPKTYIHTPPYPELNVKSAISAHYQILERVKLGIDPKQELKQAFEREALALTVNEIWDEYQKKLKEDKRADSTLYDYKNRYQKWIMPDIGKIKFKDLTEQDCAKLIKKIYKNSGKGDGGAKTAKVCLTMLRGLSVEAVHQSQITTRENPTLGLTNKFFKFPTAKAKNRVLELRELETLWAETNNQIENKYCSTATGVSILIAILTGMRRQEIIYMEKKHLQILDDGSARYLIPKNLMKAREAHVVVLTTFAMNQIRRIVNNDSPYIFASERKKAEPKSLEKDVMNDIIDKMLYPKKAGRPKLNLEHFSPHDIRRSFATGLKTQFKASSTIIHKMIAHGTDDNFEIEDSDKVDKRLEETYIVDGEELNQQQLWQSWSDLIEKSVNPDNGNSLLPQT